jgi:hypothetical protein
LQIPKPDSPHQAAYIGNHPAHPLECFWRTADRQNQEYRDPRERRDDALRFDRNAIGGIDHRKYRRLSTTVYWLRQTGWRGAVGRDALPPSRPLERFAIIASPIVLRQGTGSSRFPADMRVAH